MENVDLVFGGPPCQGYSQIGTRTLEDKRNNLYLQFARILKVLQPPVFLMENVPNVLLLNKGYYKDLVLAELQQAGYSNTTFLKILASDFSVPQDRKRVFFIGVHDSFRFPYDLAQFVAGVLDELKVREPVTVWDAISDLPAEVVPSGETMPYPTGGSSAYQRAMRLDYDSPVYSCATKMKCGISRTGAVKLHNHHTKEIQERRLKLISLLKPGKKANSLPESVWKGARPEKWRRLHPGKPTYTLLANMHRDLSEFVHPSLNRWITVREAARLQSFHDGFVLVGSEWQQLKQVGNAVPPLLGRAMGTVAMSLLDSIAASGTTSHQVKRPLQTVLPFSEPA
ncbi:MAG: DNA cytosine methyltransferase [Actinomycetota bacterium]|nr:DNA cytosine methyltransferase [Actinomycetota bacterium]MDQ3921440.1 DNA cytosine methyltransferase [Actinomycetota bacterium]